MATNTKTISQQEAERRVKALHNGEYTLQSKFINSKSPITLKHNCGLIYELKSAKVFMTEDGGKCPVCARSTATRGEVMTEEIFLKRFNEQVANEYTYLGGFKKYKEYVQIRHDVCGHEYQVTPQMLLGVKQRRCPKCGNARRGKHLVNTNYLEDALASQTYGNEYRWNEKYSGNNKDMHSITHLVCQTTYTVRPNDFQQGYRCPKCSLKNNKSYLTKDFIKFLETNEIPYVEEKKFEKCKNIRALPFDFYFEDNLLIVEIDGQQHFKVSGTTIASPEKFLSTRKHDIIKNKYVKDNLPEFTIIRFNFRNKIEDIIEVLCSEDMINVAVSKGCLVISNGVVYNQESYYSIELRDEEWLIY